MNLTLFAERTQRERECWPCVFVASTPFAFCNNSARAAEQNMAEYAGKCHCVAPFVVIIFTVKASFDKCSVTKGKIAYNFHPFVFDAKLFSFCLPIKR